MYIYIYTVYIYLYSSSSSAALISADDSQPESKTDFHLPFLEFISDPLSRTESARTGGTPSYSCSKGSAAPPAVGRYVKKLQAHTTALSSGWKVSRCIFIR